MTIDPNLTLACGTVLVSAAVAWGTRSTNRKLKTGNGKDIGAYVVDLAREQKLQSLAIVGANAKVDAVAADLALERVNTRADRLLMQTHIAADEAFQTRVEPFLIAAPIAAAAVASTARRDPNV